MHAPRLDQFGDELPRGALARLGTTRFRHGFQQVAPRWSRDGRLLATARPGGVDLWDARLGSHLRDIPVTTPQGGPADVVDSAFLPDGALVVFARSSISVWEPETCSLVRWIDADGGCAAVSPDGRMVVGLDAAHAAQRWDLLDGRALGPLTNFRGEPLGRAAFTPDGRTILAGDRWHSFVGRFDAQTGAFEGPLVDRPGVVTDLAFSRDGAELALALGAGPVRRFSLRDWSELPPLAALSAEGHTTTLAAADDGSWVICRGGALGRVHPGEAAPRWRRDHRSGGTSVALSPDDRVLAVGGAGAVRRVDAATGERLSEHGHSAPVAGLRALPDGSLVSFAEAWPRELFRWRDDGRGPEALPLEDGARSVTLSPDGARVAFVDREQTLRFAPLDDLAARDPAVALDDVRRAIVLPDGRVVVQRASGPFVFDPADGRVARCGEPWESVAAVSADGALVALQGRKLMVRRTADGAAVQGIAHPAPIADAAFTGDGASLVTLSHGDGLRVWDVATGKARMKLLRVPTASFIRTRRVRLAMTSDGAFALVGDEAGNLHGADLAARRASWLGTAHRGGVTALALDEATGTAWSGGGDTTILRWDLAALRLGRRRRG